MVMTASPIRRGGGSSSSSSSSSSGVDSNRSHRTAILVILAAAISISAVWANIGTSLFIELLPSQQQQLLAAAAAANQIDRVAAAASTSSTRRTKFNVGSNETRRRSDDDAITQRTEPMPTCIISFVDDSSKERGIAWYRTLERLGYSEHFLVAVDAETVAYLIKQNIPKYDVLLNPPCTPLRGGSDPQLYRRQLSARKWKYVHQQLKGADGRPPRHVLLTNARTMFRYRYPMSELERSEFDVHYAYHSPGGDVRPNVSSGMVWLRSAPGVKKFVSSLLNKCKCLHDESCYGKQAARTCACDDQTVLNELLTAGKHRVRWDNNRTLSLERDDMWDYATGTSEKTGHRVKIWDREFAYQGLMLKACPGPNNWAVMLFGATRSVASMKWDRLCNKASDA